MTRPHIHYVPKEEIVSVLWPESGTSFWTAESASDQLLFSGQEELMHFTFFSNSSWLMGICWACTHYFICSKYSYLEVKVGDGAASVCCYYNAARSHEWICHPGGESTPGNTQVEQHFNGNGIIFAREILNVTLQNPWLCRKCKYKELICESNALKGPYGLCLQTKTRKILFSGRVICEKGKVKAEYYNPSIWVISGVARSGLLLNCWCWFIHIRLCVRVGSSPHLRLFIHCNENNN